MLKKVVIIIIFCILQVGLVYADDKTWGGGGDGENWSDQYNWYPAEVPTVSDDVLVDLEGGSVTCDRTFMIKSITIGGRESITMTTDSFIFGAIEPDSTSDIAVLNRSGGKLILAGAGVITLKGQYQSSKENLAATSEPSFMFWIK